MLYSEFVSKKQKENVQKNASLTGDDNLIFIYDATIFSNGKKGIVCTSDELVVFDAKNVARYKLSDIQKAEISDVDKENYIIKLEITTKDGSVINITPKKSPNDELRLIEMFINKNI